MDVYTSTAKAFADALTWQEWWAEWRSNACCPDSVTAAHRLCGCGGSGRELRPGEVSRLLLDPEGVLYRHEFQVALP